MLKNGMITALMDEYIKSTIDLRMILSNLAQSDFEVVRDENEDNESCRSIQTVIFHVIQSGFTYANYVNQLFGKSWVEYQDKINSPKEGVTEIVKMLNFTEKALSQLHACSQSQIESYSIKSRWNVTYDVEQLIEHTIVHLLRHRRQIENFLI